MVCSIAKEQKVKAYPRVELLDDPFENVADARAHFSGGLENMRTVFCSKCLHLLLFYCP